MKCISSAATAFFLAVAACQPTMPALAQPTVSDLVDTNAAFIKPDRNSGQFPIVFPSTVTVSGTIYAYYIRSDSAGKSGVGLQTSTDGVSWADQGLVLDVESGQWDSNMASFPGVWHNGNTFYMVYEGNDNGAPGASHKGNIGLATSTDGKTWTRSSSNPILSPQGSAFESVNVGTPSLYNLSGTWYLYYHGYNGTTCQIGVATGTSLTSLARNASNPIVKTGSGWDAGAVGRRDMLMVGSKYYMVHEGASSNCSGTQWSSGIAESSDLLTWTEYSQNNVLNQTNSGFGFDGPAFMTIGGYTYIYYRNTSGPESRAIIANETYGGILHSFAAYGGAGIQHQIGRADSSGWSVNTAQDKAGYMIYGPYSTSIESGYDIAVFKLMIDNNTADNNAIIFLDVHDATTNTVLASRTLQRSAWKNTLTYNYFDLPFYLPTAGDMIEFRVYWYGGAYVRAGLVGSN